MRRRRKSRPSRLCTPCRGRESERRRVPTQRMLAANIRAFRLNIRGTFRLIPERNAAREVRLFASRVSLNGLARSNGAALCRGSNIRHFTARGNSVYGRPANRRGQKRIAEDRLRGSVVSRRNWKTRGRLTRELAGRGKLTNDIGAPSGQYGTDLPHAFDETADLSYLTDMRKQLGTRSEKRRTRE
jgi:hypothetical protein